VRLHVGEDGGLDEVSGEGWPSVLVEVGGRRWDSPLSSVTGTSLVDSGSLVLSGLDVGHDAVELELRGLGTLERVGGEGGSELDRLDLLGEEVEELGVDGLLDEDTGSSAARLSVVEEESEAPE
jgi:hypothetical protein